MGENNFHLIFTLRKWSDLQEPCSVMEMQCFLSCTLLWDTGTNTELSMESGFKTTNAANLELIKYNVVQINFALVATE